MICLHIVVRIIFDQPYRQGVADIVPYSLTSIQHHKGLLFLAYWSTGSSPQYKLLLNDAYSTCSDNEP